MIAHPRLFEEVVLDNSTSRRRIGLALLLSALAVLAVATIVIVLTLRGHEAVDRMNAQLAELERLQDAGETITEMTGERARSAAADFLKFDLPPSAANIFFARQGTVRPAYWLRFSLDRQDVEAFLAHTCLDALADGAVPAFQYDIAPDVLVNLTWWRPETAVNPAGGTCDWREAAELRLLLDRQPTGQQTIYLEITGRAEAQDD